MYKRWTISYAAGIWFAHRFGLRMRSNSKSNLYEMIDLIKWDRNFIVWS